MSPHNSSTDCPALILLPLRTARLTIRMLRGPDATTLARYRSIWQVARFQDWPFPYPLAAADQLAADQADADGPLAGSWVQLAIELGTTMVGDVAVGVDQHAAVATIGYTLAPEHQGHGYATEAVGAVVQELWKAGIVRIEAGIDPDNHASARLLSRLGFVDEGAADLPIEVRGAWVADQRFSLSPPQ